MDDRDRRPTIDEIGAYVDNPLFEELYASMRGEYGALCAIDYSGDNALPGWNVRFKKAGKTLCRVYPRKGGFGMLLVVGGREKQRVEELLPTFSDGFRAFYESTPEGMGQRWLVFAFEARTAIFDDALKVIRIRRQCAQIGKGGQSEALGKEDGSCLK